MEIKTVAFSFALALGSALLLSVAYVFVKRQMFGIGGVVLIVFGSLLVGLSVWTSFEVSVSANGSITAKYNKEIKEELTVKAADLGGGIEQIKFRIDELSQDVAALKKATPQAAASKAEVAARARKAQSFVQNSDYSVLVFYKYSQKKKATQISQKLLAAGFRSSATSTELREAARQFASNTAWIVYTQKGQEVLPVLKELLPSSVSDMKFVYRESPYGLRNGDIQIMLF